MRAAPARAQQRGRRHRGVVELDVLLGRVADAGRVAHEAPSRPAGARRARPRRGRRSRRARGGRRARRQHARRSNVDALGARRGRERDLDARRRRQLGAPRPRASARQPVSRSRLRRAGVEPQRARCDGTVVSAFGSTTIRAAVTTKSGSPPASSSARDDQPRGGGQRVAALVARRRAGVVGAAREASTCEPQPRGQRASPRRRARRAARGRASGRCAARGSRAAASSHAGASASRVRVDAGRAHRVARARRRRRRRGEHVVDVEPPDQRARAERRRVEARALLVGERDHGDAGQRARRPRTRPPTPSAPSKRPPLRTLSRCEPVAHHGPGASGHGPEVARRVALHAAARRRAPGRANHGSRGRRPRASTPAASVPSVAEADRHRGPRAASLELGGGDHARTRHAWSGRTQASSPAAITARDRVVAEAVRDVLDRAVEHEQVGALARPRSSRARRTSRAPRRRSAWPRAAPRARSSRSGARPAR